MKNFFSLAVLFGLCTLQASLYGDPAQILEAIQEKTSWKPLAGAEPHGTFDSKSLPSYRPKDADIFVEYGFSRLTRSGLTDAQGRQATLDLYEMIDSPAAYGLFTFLRDPSAELVSGIGNTAVQSPSELAVQQNRYYFSLKATGKDTSLRESLLALARVISHLLPNKFGLPFVVEKLPTANRVPLSERFFMGSSAFTRLFPMSSKDPFGLDTGAEASLAKYQSEREAATLLLIHYPTPQLAKKFLDAGYAQYASSHPDQPVFYKRDGPMVVLVLASNSAELATTLLDKVSYVSTVSWDPKVEPRSIGQVMVNIFVFCGIMLAMTFAAGFIFGIVRICVKRLFPGKVFDRPETMEVIRLNLNAKK